MKKKLKQKGIFRSTEKGFGFVELEDENKEDVFIAPQMTKNALNGDKVEFIVINPASNNRRAEGKIVKVLERARTEVVGMFQKSKGFGFVIPDDLKLGTDIFIPKDCCKNAQNNDKVVVEITRYPEKGKNAEGIIKEILGQADEARSWHVITC